MYLPVSLKRLALSMFICTAAAAQTEPAGSNLTCSEMEQLLLHGKIGAFKNISTGIAGTRRTTVDDGKISHAAHIQTIDESKTHFESARRNELNFRDSYKFNIAAYELAKILGLNMVPPYVERKVGSNTASVSWWVDNAMMEKDRHKKKLEPPDQDAWNKEMYAVRVFHELVYDTDPNLTNILITKDWRIWIIDLSRGFRTMKTIENPKNLVKIDRKLLATLRDVDKFVLTKTLGHYLSKMEIDGLDARKQAIVAFFDKEIAKKGERAVLYDFPRTTEPCGTGLLGGS